jgi:hypothetical protein
MALLEAKCSSLCLMEMMRHVRLWLYGFLRAVTLRVCQWNVLDRGSASRCEQTHLGRCFSCIASATSGVRGKADGPCRPRREVNLQGTAIRGLCDGITRVEVATFLCLKSRPKENSKQVTGRLKTCSLELLRRKSTSHIPPAREFVPRDVPFPSDGNRL